MTAMSQVYRKREAVVSRRIADEALLIPIRGKLADLQRVFGVNPVAELVWDSLDGERSLGQIADLVAREFAVDAGQAEADLRDFIDELRRQDLVVEADGDE